MTGDSRTHASPEAAVRALYRDLLGAWNRRDARAYAALFGAEASVVGFDGSVMEGAEEIETTLAGIFAHHPTASYVSIVRGVRMLGEGVALLRAAVGMAPRGSARLNEGVNAVQALVAARRDGAWRIELFQNTPAAFHGRPELAAALTAELEAALREGSDGVERPPT